MSAATQPSVASRSPLRAFFAKEASAGLVLMAAAALGLLAANSPVTPTYFAALKTYVDGLSVLHWINDALMVVFFLLVGLEIKRELLEGRLRTWPDRVLPGLAAIGGMAAPAPVYLSVNASSPGTMRGWAIPAATDIAFALGVLALLGSRVTGPLSRRSAAGASGAGSPRVRADRAIPRRCRRRSSCRRWRCGPSCSRRPWSGPCAPPP